MSGPVTVAPVAEPNVTPLIDVMLVLLLKPLEAGPRAGSGHP